MNWKTIAIVSSLVAYLYMLITEWIDLFPWNDVSTSTFDQKLSGSLANVLPFALVVAAFWFDWPALKIAAIALLGIWLLIHFIWWWIPYFWGASAAHMETYHRLWSRVYTLLPPRGANPIPTAQYVIWQILVLATTVVSILALAAGRVQGK